MRILGFLAVLVCACTKPNPNLCCSDEADCNANGIPVGMVCSQGLVCRGHQCIAETCGTSADCEPGAPFCSAGDGLCASTCTDDIQCPGFGQDQSDRFCVGGACVTCRVGMNDCSAATPVCDAGSCRSCKAHGECASGVCASDGTCATDDQIAFVAPAGSTTSACDRVTPCTLGRGVSIGRSYVLLSPGSYQNAATLSLGSAISLIGSGTRPSITNTSAGSIIQVQSGGDVHLTNVQLSGATGTLTTGFGLECPSTTGARTVTLIDVVVANNAADGVSGQSCTVAATRSSFTGNGGSGLYLKDNNAVIDRCVFASNARHGLEFDQGILVATNSFLTRNAVDGMLFGTGVTGSSFEFNTVADNGRYGLNVQSQTPAPWVGANNLVARNTMAGTFCSNCTFPGSLIVSDVTSLHFVSPDAQPYDYHLSTGSVAIDAATAATLDHDFDGEARPKGVGRDVGADEAQ